MRMRDEINSLYEELIEQNRIIISLEEKVAELEGPKKPQTFYAGQFGYLDGNPDNKSWSNSVLVCPGCQAQIVLSRFTPEEIWLLRTRGLSNAEIGRLIGLTRERVRQLCKRYEEQRSKSEAPTESNVNELVRKAEHVEDVLMDFGTLKRKTDRRTKKKRIIAEIDRLKAKEASNEGKRKAKRKE